MKHLVQTLTLLLFSLALFSQNPVNVTNVANGLKINSTGPTGYKNVAIIDNTIFFVSGDNGHALWKYNTTTGAYLLVRDFYPGSSNGIITSLVGLNGKVYFTASADFTAGIYDIYVSDGTDAGTVLLFTSTATEMAGSNLQTAGNYVFFSTNIQGTADYYLYSITGNTVANLKQISSGFPTSIAASNSVSYGGYLFFTGYEPSTGIELWRSDGTPGGTGLFANMSSDSPEEPYNSSIFQDFVVVDNQLIFTGAYHTLVNTSGIQGDDHDLIHSGIFKMTSPSSAPQLFYSYYDGLGNPLTHIEPSFNAYIQPNENPVLNGVLYFGASTIDASGQAEGDGGLYRTDGTAAGTYLVQSIPGGSVYQNPSKFNNQIIFAETDAGGSSMWLTDGTTSGTHKIGDKFVDPPFVGKFYIKGNRLYSSGYYDGVSHAANSAVWSTDGTNEGTVILTPDCYSTSPGSTDIFVRAGDSIYFQGQFNGCVNNFQLNKFTIPTKIWLGKISTDWNDPNNWDPAGVPGNTDDIVIPAGITNYPIISANAFARNLWINWGSVSVASSVQLTVNGELSAIGNLTGDGSLVMATAGNDNLHGQGTIDIASVIINGSDVTLKGDKQLKKIVFQNDGKIFLGDNNLALSDNTTPVSGSNSNRYFVTNGAGTVTLKNIDETGKIFPVGTSSATYSPITIANGNGYDFSVNVQDTFTYAPNDTNRTVHSQWNISTAGTQTGNNVTLTPQWKTNREGVNFQRTNALVLGHYGTAWEEIPASTVSGPDANGLYSTTVIGVTSFSPFGVGNTGAFIFSGYTTAQNGDWSAASTWVGGNVPPDGASVVINHIVSMDISPTINSGDSMVINGTLICGYNTVSGTGKVIVNGLVKTINGAGFSGASNASFSNTLSSVTLNQSSTVEYGELFGGVIITPINYANLTSSGAGDRILPYGATIGISGTFNPGPNNWSSLGSSIINYNGTAPQNIPSIPYDNISFSNTGIKALSADISVNGNLTIDNNATLDASTNNYSITISGDWTNNGSFIQNAGTVTLNSSANSEAIEGTSATTFKNLTINNNSGIGLGQNIEVTGSLGLQSGKINTSNNKVFVSGSGTIAGGGASAYVNGTLQRSVSTGNSLVFFPIGESAGYVPVSLAFTGVTTAGDLTVTVSSAPGKHPQITTSTLNPDKAVDRYWTLSNNGISGGTYDATFEFLNNDVDAGADPNKFIVGQYNNGTWTYPASVAIDINHTKATGVNGFGDFQIAELNCPAPVISSQPISITICQNSAPNSLSVSANGDGLSYQWYSNTINSNSGGTSLNASGLGPVFSPSSVAYGTLYYYCVVSAACGTAVSDVASVTVNPTPDVSAGTYGSYYTTDPVIILNGSPVGGVFGGEGVTGDTFDPAMAGAGNHIITYTYVDINTGCVNSGTAIIIVSMPCNFTVDTLAGPRNACPYSGTSGTNATYSIAATSAASYNWTLPAGATLVSGTNTASSIQVHYASTFASGTISVTVSSLCSSPVTKSQLITKSVPTVPVSITGPLNVCPYIGTSTSVTYSIPPVAGAVTYRWTLPTTVTLLSASPDSTIITITFNTGFDAGTNKSIKVKSISGCGNSADKTLTLSVTKPAVPAAIAGPANACIYIGGSQATYTTRVVANATSYVWTVPVGATIISHPNGAGVSDTVINVSFDNSFVSGSNISVQSASGCGISTARSFAVTRTLPATPGVIAGLTDVCSLVGTPATTIYAIRKVSNATLYNWTVPAGASAIHQNAPGINDTAIVVSFSNTFNGGAITVNAGSGCGNSVNRSLTIAAKLPATPGTITGPTDPCPIIGISDAVYTIRKVANATSYTWAVPGGAVISSHPAGAGINDTVITVTYSNAAANGNVSVTANNNCATSSPRNLTITRKLPSTPGAITGPTDPCPFIGVTNVSYTIRKVVNATSYTWSVPAGATISSHPAGTGINDTIIAVAFTNSIANGNISVIANNNCASSSPKTLALARKLPGTPATITVTALSTICPNRQYYYSVSALPANATSLNWTVPAGATIITQGTLSVTVQYGSGAVSDTIRVVGVNNCAISSERKLKVTLPACTTSAVIPREALILKPASPDSVAALEFQVKVFPNPSATYFHIQLISPSNEVAMMRVIDVSGRELIHARILPNQLNQFGSDLNNGIYFVEIIQGNYRQVVKLLKLFN